jgi:hypothetical protein
MLSLADFEVVRKDRQIVFPLRAPLVSELLNHFLGHLPLVDQLSLVFGIIARGSRSPPLVVGCGGCFGLWANHSPSASCSRCVPRNRSCEAGGQERGRAVRWSMPWTKARSHFTTRLRTRGTGEVKEAAVGGQEAIIERTTSRRKLASHAIVRSTIQRRRYRRRQRPS